MTGAQRLFGTKNVDSINVGVEKDANVDEIMMSIERILRAQHDIGPGADNDFNINDYSQFSDLRRQATGIFTALATEPCPLKRVAGAFSAFGSLVKT